MYAGLLVASCNMIESITCTSGLKTMVYFSSKVPQRNFSSAEAECPMPVEAGTRICGEAKLSAIFFSQLASRCQLTCSTLAMVREILEEDEASRVSIFCVKA